MTDKKLKFATKRDINGNIYSLVIDLSAREYSQNNWIDSDFIRISRADMRRIIETLNITGYKSKNI